MCVPHPFPAKIQIQDPNTPQPQPAPQPPAPSTSSWTPAQDETINSMRQRGDSWRMIAQAVGAAKRDVVARWKELCEAARDDDLAGVAAMFDDGPAGDKGAAASTPKGGHHHHHHHHRNSPSNPQPSQQPHANDAAVRVDLAALEDDAAHKSLRPDAVWTVADLEVLADLEQQYRRLKWMHVQAGFYNMTGRMVGAEVIRAKFEEG